MMQRYAIMAQGVPTSKFIKMHAIGNACSARYMVNIGGLILKAHDQQHGVQI